VFVWCGWFVLCVYRLFGVDGILLSCLGCVYFNSCVVLIAWLLALNCTGCCFVYCLVMWFGGLLLLLFGYLL